ncbi:MAG TPA: GntR family transcriptional regulator [Candidatus Marinimicrobia bacterium]|nr:GntR family transcriptional regulator [Candidatus Neomarinimicrobiota bacterium]
MTKLSSNDLTEKEKLIRSAKFNRNGIIPMYYQLKELISDWIADGEYKPHDQLPSENELRTSFSVSRNTAQKALKTLVDKGVAYRIQGKGTFVADPQIAYSITATLSFSSEIIGLRKEPRNILNFSKATGASSHIARLLEIEEGDQVCTIQRIRLVDDIPAALMTSYLPVDLVPRLLDTLVVDKSLFQTIKREYGIEVGSGFETLQVGHADEYEAKQLGIREGDAVFMLERISKTTEGIVLELAKTVLRGDISKIYVELT